MTCTGWTSEGNQQRFADESAASHALFIEERRVRAEQGLEHGYFSECTPKYAIVVKQCEPLKDTHDVKMIINGPELHAEP